MKASVPKRLFKNANGRQYCTFLVKERTSVIFYTNFVSCRVMGSLRPANCRTEVGFSSVYTETHMDQRDNPQLTWEEAGPTKTCMDEENMQNPHRQDLAEILTGAFSLWGADHYTKFHHIKCLHSTKKGTSNPNPELSQPKSNMTNKHD